ncbi:unnamed protein product, partial [Medioppia subpectinata]
KRLLMLGLDSSGKTSVAERISYWTNEPVLTLPGRDFTVWHVKYKGHGFTLWDCSGSRKSRDLWRNHYTGTYGLVFVVDAGDRHRVSEAKRVLHSVCNDREMKDVVVLVLVNKQDRPNAMRAKEIEFILCMNRLRQKHWYIKECSARDGRGFTDCLLCFVPHMSGHPLHRSAYTMVDTFY